MHTSHESNHDRQFGMAALLEFVAVCSILAALSPVLGLVTSMLLMGMAVCLALRWGVVALGLFAAAFLVCGNGQEAVDYLRMTLVVMLTIAMCVWVRKRRESDSLRSTESWADPSLDE